MKKTASLLLALVMIMSCFSAMAATVNNATINHSYQAYQVFAGTQAASEGALGDITWGTGVDGAALLTALQADYDYFDTCSTAADVANILAGKGDNCDEAKALANTAAKNLTSVSTAIAAGATSVEMAPGYWLLVDTTDVDGEDDARNSALLQVTSDIEITQKYTAPQIDKTIKGEEEAADANIGDTITFVLTATLGSNVTDYDAYKVVFHDVMSAGLTYVDGSAIVKIGEAAKTADFEIKADVDETTGVTTITISNDNVRALGAGNSSVITVEYQATVNSGAVIGSAGNPNEVYLEYSNDPNWNGEPEEEPTGETPEDKVIVFVYQLDADKVDGQDAAKKLPDAEFVLLSSDESKIAEVAGGRLVKWVNASAVAKNEDGTYPSAYTLKTDANGEFAIAGLDAGTYYLKEAKAPVGYNLLTNPIKLVITAVITDSEDTQKLDKLTISVDDEPAVDGDAATGAVSITVKNNAGVELPETGGMGTTLLYVGGGVLVLAAIVLLIVKRRSAE